MTKKLSKILSIVMIVMMAMIMITNIVYATDPGSYTGTTNFSGKTSIDNLGNSIIGLVKVVGTIVSVAILIVIGIKYMMGSTEEKAEYKKTLIPYVVGAVIVFAASWLSGIVYDWASSLK